MNENVSFNVVRAICYTLLALFAAGLLWLLYMFISFLTWMTQPSAAEMQAKAVQEQQIDAKLAEQDAFKAQQEPLWAQPSSAITQQVALAELDKCKDAIRKGSQSPYQMLFSEVQAADVLQAVRTGIPVELTSQQKIEFPDKVAITGHRCHFKGVGYEYVSQSNAQFADRYIPN